MGPVRLHLPQGCAGRRGRRRAAAWGWDGGRRRLEHFVGAVGLSGAAAAAQNPRATPVPPGVPGVELRETTLTLKANVTWDAQGAMHRSPAKPGDSEAPLSQLLLAFEPVPRLPARKGRDGGRMTRGA